MNPATLGVFIPIIAVGGPFLFVIVKTMTQHQQRMAELYHRNAQPISDPRVEALTREMAELKDLVHQQTIVLDRLASLPTRPTEGGIEGRLNA